MAFNESKKFKNFMAKLYGWGASVVILGALFKIQHWPGSGIMLTVGLGTEAIIFFFSAFEKPHVDYDWSLVYPEFAGLHDEEDDNKKSKKKNLTQELDKMLEKAKIGPDLIESLGHGLRNLSDNTSKMTDITQASVATNEYAGKMRNVSKSVDELSQTFAQTNDAFRKDINVTNELANTISNVKDSAQDLAGSYKQASSMIKSDVGANEEYVQSMQAASKSAQMLAQNYQKTSDMLVKSSEAVDFSAVNGNELTTQIQSVSKNLAALNSVYELQLRELNNQVSAASNMNQGINEFIDYLKNSTNDTKKFNEAVAQLAQNISALNNVYGNMLSAMNVNR